MVARTVIGDLRVVLLTGEGFQRLERLAEYVESAVDPATRDFNYDVILPDDLKKDNGVGRLTDLVMTFPMIAERRVVVVRDFDSVHAETRKKVAAALQKTPDTTLVLVEAEKAALTPKPPERYFRQETFKRLYERDLPSWIRGRFVKRGRRAEEGAIALLLNNVGDVLGELDNEVEKVCVGVGDRTNITEDDVGRIVGAFRRHTVYALCTAVGVGDFAEAARVLRSLMETEKNKETFYVTTLAGHLMKLAEYHTLLRSGTPKDEAVKAVSGSSFLWRLNRMDEQVRLFSSPDVIRRALEAIAETDSALKKSGVDKGLLVELLLPKLIPRNAGIATSRR